MSSNSSLVVQMTTDQLKSLFMDALRDVLGGKNLDLSSSSAPAKGKRGSRKPRDPDAPKKEPNDWIKFTSRVRSVLGPQMEDGKKVAPKAVTQVSSALKDASLMPSATDAQIIAAYKNWLANPPAVSKMVSEGRDKKSKKSKGDSTVSSGDGSSVASSKSAPAPAPADASADGKKKGRKPMTDEQKAAAKAKRDAKKAAKSSASTSAESAAPAEDSAADSSADFEPFKWKKMSLLKNARGDVLTEDMEWFGHWDSKTDKIDTNAPQPADLEL